MRVADYIFEKLVEEGVTRPFVVTGRGALFLDDAIAKRKDLRPCFVHHEQSAAFAATAVSEAAGELGCAVVSTGCASTNTLTGVLSAWQDGIPVVFISGQNTLHETTRHTGIPLRSYGQQEADIVELVAPMTKYAVMITDPERIRYELEKALALAREGRRGPVWIDVPLDVQNMRVEPAELAAYDGEHPSLGADSEQVRALAEQLSAAERPVLLIGSGVKHSGSEATLATFAERHKIPVVFTASACDAYGAKHPLSIGSFSSMGASRAGAFAVQNADLVVVLGSRLNSMTTGPDFCKFARHARVVVVDIDATEHSKEGVRIDQLITADLADFFEKISACEVQVDCGEWVAKCQHWKKTFKSTHMSPSEGERVDMYELADALSETLPSDAIFVCDSGFADVILPTNIDFGGAQRCVHPVSQGAMGFALPAAVGLGLCTQRPTVAVIGDGSIMMNLQEFQTLADYGGNTKIFVVNNNVYAIIRRRQKELFRRRTIGTDATNGVKCPEFEKVAECFGVKYRRIESSTNLAAEVASVLTEEGPVLCEVMGLEDQQYVEVGYARNSDRKFVRRPLEDQWPFLERELFLREMIVAPVDQ